MICCSTTPLLTHQLSPRILIKQSWKTIWKPFSKCNCYRFGEVRHMAERQRQRCISEVAVLRWPAIVSGDAGRVGCVLSGQLNGSFLSSPGATQDLLSFWTEFSMCPVEKLRFRSSEPCVSMTQPITRSRHQGWWCPVPDLGPWRVKPPELVYLKGHQCLVLLPAPIGLMVSVSQCQCCSVHFLHLRSYCVKLSSQWCPSGVSTAPD